MSDREAIKTNKNTKEPKGLVEYVQQEFAGYTPHKTRIRLLQILCPGLVLLVAALAMYFSMSWAQFKTLGSLMFIYLFPPLGKESIIPMGIVSGFHPLVIAVAIAFVDILIGLFLIWNFDYIYFIPLLGPWVKKVEAKGYKILARRYWVRQLAFWGLVLWVIIPFQGTGAVTASIIGRLIGMNKYLTWTAIIVGALAGCILIAYLVTGVLTVYRQNLFIALGLISLIILISVFAYIKYWRVK